MPAACWHPRELRQARFIRGRLDDLICTGIHLARRHDWPDDRPWGIVYVEVIEDADGTWTSVWQFGSAVPESWRDWEIRAALTGLDTLTSAAFDIEPIEDATTPH